MKLAFFEWRKSRDSPYGCNWRGLFVSRDVLMGDEEKEEGLNVRAGIFSMVGLAAMALRLSRGTLLQQTLCNIKSPTVDRLIC